MNKEPIIKEVILDAVSSKIWKAITDAAEMKQWYFDLPGFKPKVGYEFQFYGGTDKHQYLHLCRITEVIPEKIISYTWRYENYPGSSLVIFELIPEGSKTKVRLTHEGVESFPADNPDMSKKNFVEGWNYIIGSSLKEFVEKD